MRTALRRGKLVVVQESHRLILELDPGADPVRGTVGLPDSGSKPFFGYVQLIAAIERVRHVAHTDPVPVARPAIEGERSLQ